MTTTERHPDSERSYGKDGVSGLVTTARAMRARDVSRPSQAQIAEAKAGFGR